MLRIGALSLLFFQCFWLINSKKAPITKIRTGIVIHRSSSNWSACWTLFNNRESERVCWFLWLADHKWKILVDRRLGNAAKDPNDDPLEDLNDARVGNFWHQRGKLVAIIISGKDAELALRDGKPLARGSVDSQARIGEASQFRNG